MMPIPGHVALPRVSPQGWVSLTLKPTGGSPSPSTQLQGYPKPLQDSGG